MLKGRQISEQQAQAWMERKNDYYKAFLEGMTPADILPGSRELLAELRRAGIKTAVASASKNARTVLENIGLMESVDVVCDGYSVSEPKPAPDLFLFAAAQLGLAPQACVVVEDAEAGVEAALAAGMRCIGLGPPERVGKAQLVCPSLEGLTLAEIMHRLD
jgi:kojibiose phosphorylase